MPASEPESDSQPQLERVDGGVARTDLSDGPPFPVWAPLLKPGDVTRGGNGDGDRNENATHWTDEALAESQDMFATTDAWKVHFVDGHPKEEDIGVNDILGESLEATLSDEYGLVAAGEVDDEHTARLIANDRVGVSPWLKRTHGDWNEEKEAYDVGEVVGVRDLGVVRQGEGPSADINLGESPVARDADDAPTAEALAAVFEDVVAGNEATHADAPTARSDKSGGGEQSTETMAASESEQTQQNSSGGGGGGDGDGSSDSQPTNPSEMSEEQLVEEVRTLRDERASMKEQIQELRGQVKGLGGDVEELESAWDNLEDGLVEALSDQTGLDTETVESNFSRDGMVEALDADPVEAFRGATGNDYTPDPQTGDPDPEGGANARGGGQSGGVETLSADEKREVENIEQRIGLFEGRSGMEGHVEALEDQRDEILNGGGPERPEEADQ